MDPELVWIANATGATSVRRGACIQSLWSGYGEIFRVELTGADVTSAIVKWVKPPPHLSTHRPSAGWLGKNMAPICHPERSEARIPRRADGSGRG